MRLSRAIKCLKIDEILLVDEVVDEWEAGEFFDEAFIGDEAWKFK